MTSLYVTKANIPILPLMIKIAKSRQTLIIGLQMFFLKGSMTWYVVYRGKKPGVYETWASYNEQVAGIEKTARRVSLLKKRLLLPTRNTHGL